MLAIFVQDRYINIYSVVINAIVLIYSLSKIGATAALAARLASSAVRFFSDGNRPGADGRGARPETA